MPRALHAKINLMLAIAVALGLAYAAARDTYNASHLRYALTPDSLVIHHRGREIILPYREIRSVTFFRQPPPMRKTSFGTSLSRGRIGRYKIEGIGQVGMYASDAKLPLIVVETRDAKYGLTPAEGEEFYRQLAARVPKRGQQALGAG